MYLFPDVISRCVSKLDGATLFIVLDGLEQLDDTLSLDFLHGDSPQVEHVSAIVRPSLMHM